MRRYKVYLEVGGKQVRVGEIEGNYSDDARFLYSKEYITKEESKSISISLPIQEEPFSPERTKAFFEGLLPEGFMRKNIAANMHFDEKNGRWYLPCGLAPSTHIVKQSHIRLDGIVTNEQLSMMAARKCGIDIPESFIINIGKGNDHSLDPCRKAYLQYAGKDSEVDLQFPEGKPDLIPFLRSKKQRDSGRDRLGNRRRCSNACHAEREHDNKCRIQNDIDDAAQEQNPEGLRRISVSSHSAGDHIVNDLHGNAENIDPQIDKGQRDDIFRRIQKAKDIGSKDHGDQHNDHAAGNAEGNRSMDRVFGLLLLSRADRLRSDHHIVGADGRSLPFQFHTQPAKSNRMSTRDTTFRYGLSLTYLPRQPIAR